MSFAKKIVLWSIVLALLGGAGYFALSPRPVMVDTEVLQIGSLTVSIEDDGVTRIRERYVVSAPLSSRLLRITWDVGDEVLSDQTVLARLEPTNPQLLDPREVAQAQARIRAAEQRLETAKAELSQSEAELQFAEREMGRLRKLLSANATSQTEFEQKELQFRQLTEKVRAATFGVDIAEYELELQRAALILTESPEDSGKAMALEIRAPINGRVLRIYEESTTVVTAGQPLMELGDPSDLEVVVDVLSRDAVRISAGDHVIMNQWGGADPLHGVVRLIEPSGFTKVSALGVEEQRVNVIVDFADPSGNPAMLGDNFRVDCQIVTWSTDETLVVPTSALYRDGPQWMLFRVEGGRAVAAAVQIGKNNGMKAEIISGANPGDQVIVYPSDEVSDGVLVHQR
ncbi:efflux RND transporter periplasmic adaptor subunit [Crateriforma conspicua]|uniref:Putative efflux system component YknX n=1 Tax=Crateriforma conspicua TaxID=2527996 RepID=A0A5C5Y694_9PLAN|nr:HlyD family efflux transporter periplasmic adaptor subunit [Crateriforma conspicua]TWT70253.1 putative efflux system component YknX [Crateriforma conspicua]